MRITYLSISAATAALLISGCATSSQHRELSKEVQTLRTDMAVLKEQMQHSKKAIVLTSRSTIPNDASTEKLGQIAFPATPTEENLKHYINEIIIASQGIRSFSPNAPQVEMLCLVGPENLHLLIDTMPNRANHGTGTYFLNYAIKKLATNDHKQIILDALQTKQALAAVILQNGWEEDARDILISELKESYGASLPSDWIKAVAALVDPNTYEALSKYMTASSNGSYIYRMIQHLPGIDLTEAVAQSWEKAKASNQSYSTASMAAIAIDYGHKDAIETLINLTLNPNRYSSSTNPRLELITHLDFKGSNKEISQWYEENKNALIFDKTTKKFRVKDASNDEDPNS